jgi:predicted DNA-binding protein
MGERKVVSDLDLLDMDADELRAFTDNLHPEETTPEERQRLLAQLPPPDLDAPITVVTSLRLPNELKQRVDAAAEAEGVTASSFIRQALERVLAGRDRTNLVNLDDAVRALRSLPHAT